MLDNYSRHGWQSCMTAFAFPMQFMHVAGLQLGTVQNNFMI